MDHLEQLIVANWKMHKTAAETREHIKRLRPLSYNTTVEIWLAVPYTSIAAAAQTAENSPIQIGAQNMSDLAAGALTGEISPIMLIEAGAAFVIIGHSERRRIFKEDDEMINRKVKLALRSDLEVILCIGETREERLAQNTVFILKSQLEKGLQGVHKEQIGKIAIAYEPVWAIGSQEPATQEDVEEIHTLCKNFISSGWDIPFEKVRVIYGGSVTSTNAKDFLTLPVVNGLLVGGASLDVQSFAEIIHQAEMIQ